jgi:hypothetical protein
LPNGDFGQALYQNDQGLWFIRIYSKRNRGAEGLYADDGRTKNVDPQEWKKISGRRPSKKAATTQCRWCKQERPDTPGICPHCHRFPGRVSMIRAGGSCPDCQTPPPSYRSGVKCPNCEYQEHSFKQWLEDTTSSMGAYGNEEDPDERGLKRIGHLNRPVPDSEMADKLFLGNKKFLRKSSKPRKSSRPVPCSLPRPKNPAS